MCVWARYAVYSVCVLAIFSVYCRCTPIIGLGGRKRGQAGPKNSCKDSFLLFFFLLCDRLSNKYHNVYVTNKHQLLFHFFSSLQGDINPSCGCPRVLFFFSTSRCCFPQLMASLSTNVRISSMENNQKATSVLSAYTQIPRVVFFFSFVDYRLRKMVSK